MTDQEAHPATRSLYLVLSPHSLPYASFALKSLWQNSVERFHLHLITDSEADKSVLTDFMTSLAAQPHSSTQPSRSWSMHAKHDLDDHEAAQFSRLPNLRAFRHGHPCWRKITDPLLLAVPGSEMVLLDPDLFFPNLFNFEATPADGLFLMWQKPNCLAPHSVVTRAMQAGVRLANHVDIGVAQWRGPADLEWLEWLIGAIGGSQLPRMMHVEAIVWAALAIRMGGGYLNPRHWHCWHRTQAKRLLRIAGIPGPQILRSEPWQTIKCFHGGGQAKWWIPVTVAAGSFHRPSECVAQNSASPFIELTYAAYRREQNFKRWLRRAGYYAVFRSA